MNLYPPKPTRATPNSEYHRRIIEDPNWIAEPKKDGDRCLVKITPGGPELWSRHGTKTRYGWLQGLANELTEWDLPVGAILDCELCHEPKPNQDLWVFDVPSAGGTLQHRREVLEALFEELPESKYIHLVPWMDKANAYDEAIDTGEEGVVFKRLDSEYVWQRSTTNAEISAWVKFKPAQQYR